MPGQLAAKLLFLPTCLAQAFETADLKTRKHMRFAILICIIALFFSCSDNNINVTDKKIDKFISKYNDVKFDELKDISILQRSRSFTEVVYVIGKGDGRLPVYFVTFDIKKEKIAGINRKNLIDKKMNDYLTSDEIHNAINIIRKYGFYFLAVDSIHNVYINPFYANEPPCLLRLKIPTGDSVVRKGHVYDLYNKEWYLNRSIK